MTSSSPTDQTQAPDHPDSEVPAQPDPEATGPAEAEAPEAAEPVEAVASTEPEEPAEAAEQAEPVAVAEAAEAEEPEEAAAEASDAEELLIEEAEAAVESPYDRPGHWFVVHTYAGYENKVKANLESRIQSMNMEDRIYEVVIPMEDVIEFKNGKKVVVQKKVFPGYLLVRCDLDDDSWYVIRNTPGVTGFVGAGSKPSPLSRRDVERFLLVVTGDEEVAAKRGK